MKQFIESMLDLTRRAFSVAAAISGRTLDFLRSVNIDLPRGVMLCVAFQLILLLAVVISFGGVLFVPVMPQSGASSVEQRTGKSSVESSPPSGDEGEIQEGVGP
jgi:hypothetical protein